MRDLNRAAGDRAPHFSELLEACRLIPEHPADIRTRFSLLECGFINTPRLALAGETRFKHILAYRIADDELGECKRLDHLVIVAVHASPQRQARREFDAELVSVTQVVPWFERDRLAVKAGHPVLLALLHHIIVGNAGHLLG